MTGSFAENRGYAQDSSGAATLEPANLGAIIDQTGAVLKQVFDELRALSQRIEPTPEKMSAGVDMPSPSGLIERAHRLRNLAHCVQEDVKRLSGKL